MARRRRAEKRPALPDIRYNSLEVYRFINKTMRRGKKTIAQRIVYNAMELIGQETKRTPLEVFNQALENTKPLLTVKPRRVGGTTYQVPVEVPPERSEALAMQWILRAARSKKSTPMTKGLAQELIDASHGEGAAAKRKEELHRMAESNRAFAHYRW